MTARHSLPIVFSLAAALAFAAPASAQSASLVPPSSPVVANVAVATGDSTPAATVNAGPTRDAASLAARPAAEVNRTPAPYRARGGFSQGEALMIVGGAAILTGIVVGGDAGHAISIGGAVVGLIGLYQYLQ
jgi:hypothetical protein